MIRLVYFTFMLPCIVVDFFLNNQPEALIIPILFCYKTLHVLGIFSAHRQEFSTIHSALVSFMQVLDDRTQAESGWNLPVPNVHSCQQKSIGLKFSNSQTGNDVRYSCHHNSSRFTFPIFAHSCRFSVLHSLQSITPRIY